MEKVKSSKFAHFVSKLAVDSEPGLTDAQLMLDNHDLKPGEESCSKMSKLVVVPLLIKCCSRTCSENMGTMELRRLLGRRFF